MRRSTWFCLSLVSLFLLGLAPSELEQQPTRIPVRFLEKEKLIPRMVQTRREWLFDLYLALLRNHAETEKNEQKVSLDELAEMTGISRRLNRSVYLRVIRQALESLQSDFQLIKIESGKKEILSLRLLDYDEPKIPLAIPETAYLELPLEYWSYQWNQKLSLLAKWVYLVELVLEKLYPAQTRWKTSFELVSERFHLSQELFEKGAGELRRYRLVAVRYQVDPSHPTELQREYFSLPIYEPETIETSISNLARQYPDSQVKLVRSYARLIYAEYDPLAIQQLLLLYHRYGDYSFKKILTTIAEEPSDSPKRSLEYAITLFQQEHHY